MTTLTSYLSYRTLIFIIKIYIWNTITFVSNIKTILKLLGPKNISAYILLQGF